jgi:plasmid transfer protein
MKKINFKQPKYIFPAIIFLPLVFLGYQISNLVSGGSEEVKKGVVTDSINMSLPEADNPEMGDKMSEMDSRFMQDGGYTAMGVLGQEKEAKDSTQSGYSEAEMDRIDAENARRKRAAKEAEEMERSLANARRHINNQSDYSGGGGRTSRRDELDDYAKELDYIQNKNRERMRTHEKSKGDDDEDVSTPTKKKTQREQSPKEQKAEIVQKMPEQNADKFNTIGFSQNVDEPLIKAMIDQTIKAHEGTRLRFKLLDDVVIKDVKIKKGTYLYGIVTGFGQQRVMATISSVLVKDKFIKINLSVFDNDGMEGFYVPESAFRAMMKDAGSQAMQSNINFNGGMGSELSGESIALQALQNMYQSASSAVSSNMRKNKARIKYNTIVYLVNTSSEN